MGMFLKILLWILIIFAVFAACMFFYITKGLSKGKNLQINNVNLSNVKDGTYNGKYNFGRWSNEVNVTIKDHKITEIEIVKDIKYVQPDFSKTLINNIIEKQKINVDAVSGATVTTKAYEKSIENALSK